MNGISEIYIEVAPEKGGGWKITKITEYSDPNDADTKAEVLGHERTRRTALKVAKGAALALNTRVQLHNKRDGQYSKGGASYRRARRG